MRCYNSFEPNMAGNLRAAPSGVIDCCEGKNGRGMRHGEHRRLSDAPTDFRHGDALSGPKGHGFAGEQTVRVLIAEHSGAGELSTCRGGCSMICGGSTYSLSEWRCRTRCRLHR